MSLLLIHELRLNNSVLDLPYVKEVEPVRCIDKLEHLVHLLERLLHGSKPISLKLRVIARRIRELLLILPLCPVLRLFQMALYNNNE